MSLQSLANPESRQIDTVVLDYFLIEAVESLRLSSSVANKRQIALEEEMARAHLLKQPITKGPDSNEEALRIRLETIGVHVGSNLVER